MRRTPGEVVVHHEIWQGDVWAARPMIVAQDDGDLVALWFPKGTIWKRPIPPSAHPSDIDRGARLARCLALREWVFEDAEWDVSTLVLMRLGDWHAVWVSWLDDGTQWGWYVNLQEPSRRTSIGFATMDLALDVLIENDRTWRWKDEDELAVFVAEGVLDEAVAERVREEGLRVAHRAEERVAVRRTLALMAPESRLDGSRASRGLGHAMPLTVGTAGHIDHGRTWLVRELG